MPAYSRRSNARRAMLKVYVVLPRRHTRPCFSARSRRRHLSEEIAAARGYWPIIFLRTPLALLRPPPGRRPPPPRHTIFLCQLDDARLVVPSAPARAMHRPPRPSSSAPFFLLHDGDAAGSVPGYVNAMMRTCLRAGSPPGASPAGFIAYRAGVGRPSLSVRHVAMRWKRSAVVPAYRWPPR